MNIHNLVASWFVFTGLVLLGTVTFGYRIIQDRDRTCWSTISKLLIGSLLLLIMAISTLPSPVPLPLYLVRVGCVQLSMLLVALAVEQSLTARSEPRLRSRQLVVIGGIALLGLTLVYQREHGVPPTQDDQITRPWAHYSSYLINYSLYLYLLGRIIRCYWRSLRPYQELPYLVRLVVCMSGFSASALGVVLLGLLDILGPTVDWLPKRMLLAGFEWSMLTSVTLLTVGFVVPNALLWYLVQPCEWVRAWRQRRRQAALCYLHQAMTRIVPDVQLHNPRLREVRLLVEISDARQMIWSRQAQTMPITAQLEAAYLAQLLRRNVVIDAPGEHQPPRTAQPDIVRHNLTVARLLKRQLARTAAGRRAERALAQVSSAPDRRASAA